MYNEAGSGFSFWVPYLMDAALADEEKDRNGAFYFHQRSWFFGTNHGALFFRILQFH